ncbi:MAG: hypothetical protein WC777_03670 [Candidatus Gracilibacteria bacterium]
MPITRGDMIFALLSKRLSWVDAQDKRVYSSNAPRDILLRMNAIIDLLEREYGMAAFFSTERSEVFNPAIHASLHLVMRPAEPTVVLPPDWQSGAEICQSPSPLL